MGGLQGFNSFLIELRPLEIHTVQFVIRIKLGELDESLDSVLIILDRHAPRSLGVKPDRFRRILLSRTFENLRCVVAQF